MSSAKARCSSGSVIAWPPYLTTTTAPWKRASQGSASMSVAALASAAERSRRRRRRSCRVRRVLVDVGQGQVVGPDGRGGRAGVQVDRDVRRRGRTGRPLERSSPAPPARQTQHAVDRDVELVGLERGAGGADGGQDPAPVGVVAEERALEQVVAGDRPADLDRVGLGRPRRRTSIAMSLVAPSASASSCRARSAQSRVDRGGELRRRRASRPDAPLASSSTVSLVDMQPSESTRSKVTRGGGPQRARRSAAASTTASVVSTQSMVARPGASMPAPLAMPPTVQPSPATTAVFGTGVGGHDRLGGAPSPPSRASAAAGLLDAGQQLRPSAAARRSGRSSRPRRRPAPIAERRPATRLGGGVGVLEARRPGAGVGAAGVEHDGARAGRR